MKIGGGKSQLDDDDLSEVVPTNAVMANYVKLLNWAISHRWLTARSVRPRWLEPLCSMVLSMPGSNFS